MAGRPEPQEGMLPTAKKAASPKASGSGSQRGEVKANNPSSTHPANQGRPLNRTAKTTNPAAPTSTKSITRGAEGSDKDATVVAGNASSRSRSKALGKVTETKRQDGQKSQPSTSSHPAMTNKQRTAEIEKETRGQRENPLWFKHRRNRITASIAHKISHCKFVNGKSAEVPQSYLKSIVGQGSTIMNDAMKWGINNESVAIRKYEQLKSEDTGHQISVQSCGLFIDPVKDWLAASPDGIVVDKTTGDTIGLVEVKCPYKHRDHTIREACKDGYFCLQHNGEEFQLKKDHCYFTQIQCQLAVLGLGKADFVVYTNCEVAIVPVEFDRTFWKNVVDKLEDFYIRAVLPELVEQNLVLTSEQ